MIKYQKISKSFKINLINILTKAQLIISKTNHKCLKKIIKNYPKVFKFQKILKILKYQPLKLQMKFMKNSILNFKKILS